MTDQQKIQALSYALGLLRGTCANVISCIVDQNERIQLINELKEVDKITERVLYKED